MSGFVVVDASLAFKWLVREEHTDKALAILRVWHNEDVTPAAPHLLPFEVSNALRKRVTRGELSATHSIGGAFGEGFPPGLNLALVDFIPGGQLGHHFLALHRFQAHLGLESWAVLPTSLRHFLLLPDSNSYPQFRSGTLT